MTIKTLKLGGKCSLVICVVLQLIGSSSAMAGSAVGNGGDIFSRYVESSRFALKESIRRLMQSPADLSRLCETEQELNPAQKDECRRFISETLKQILALNQNVPIPAFLLRDDPLLVEGPDGKPREVDARTPLGATGDIELNYPRVKFYSPLQMLTLITHECGHKVLFEGRNVEDNPPTAAFATGRMLLDSVGFAVATYAQQKGIIGSYFRLLDHFSCRIAGGAETPPMGSAGSTIRSFSSTQDFGRYETGIGIWPGNLDVFLIEPGFSEIHFRATIHEENSCSLTEPSVRWTRLELVRVYPSLDGQPGKPDEILTEKSIEQWNPVCDPDDSRRAMELGYGNFQFQCVFTGSSGTSSVD